MYRELLSEKAGAQKFLSPQNAAIGRTHPNVQSIPRLGTVDRSLYESELHQKMQMVRFHVCHGRAQSSPLRVLPRSDPLGGPLGEYFVQLRPASHLINQASNRPRGREGPQNEHCGSHFSEVSCEIFALTFKAHSKLSKPAVSNSKNGIF